MIFAAIAYVASIAVSFGVGFMAGRFRDADSKNIEIPYRVKEYPIEDIHLN